MTVLSDKLRHTLLAIAAVLLLLGGVFLAMQGGFVPGLDASADWGAHAAAFMVSLLLTMESLVVLVLLWAGAAGWGFPVRKILAPEARNKIVLQVITGLAVMLMIDWLLGWAGWLGPNTAWLTAGSGALLLIWELGDPRRRRALSPENWPDPPWTLLLGLPAFGLLIAACACPPGTLWAIEAYGYDVLSYHLQLPREWLASGAITGLKHNVFSYLPSLMEAGYMQIGAMRGSMVAGVYTAQLFHAGTALLAAIAVANLVSRFVVGSAAAGLAGVALLATPWVIITGSLAYNEMVVLAFGAGALLVAFDPESGRRGVPGAAALVGFLLGAATLAKPTAGPMLAVPVGVLMLTGLNHAVPYAPRPGMKVALRSAAIAALVGTLTLSPWMVRNAIWTGNPVFPFATGLLGKAHWDDEQANRWNSATSREGGSHDSGVVAAMGHQWLLSPGFGALTLNVPPNANIFEAHKAPGSASIPTFWVAALAGLALAITWPAARRGALALVIVMAIQVVFWLVATHRQGRFLMPMLLPACVLIGLGAGRLDQLTRQRARLTFVLSAVVLGVILTMVSFQVFYAQVVSVTLLPERPGERPQVARLEPAAVVDSLATVSGQLINRLPPTSKTLIVADNTRLLYLRNPIVYHTPFDRNPLGEVIRATGGDPQRVTAELRRHGITHVWVDLMELDRLHRTYGYDARVTEESLARLASEGKWQRVVNDEDRYAPWRQLFQLP